MSNAPLRPEDLRKIAEEAEMAKLREALAKRKKTEDHEHELREAFMSADVRPDVMDRVNAAVRNAAQQNRSELLALTLSGRVLRRQGPCHQQWRGRLAADAAGAGQEGLRLLRAEPERPRLQGPGRDHELPGRQSRRGRHLPALVSPMPRPGAGSRRRGCSQRWPGGCVMRVAVFSTKPYDRQFLEAANAGARPRASLLRAAAHDGDGAPCRGLCRRVRLRQRPARPGSPGDAGCRRHAARGAALCRLQQCRPARGRGARGSRSSACRPTRRTRWRSSRSA